MSPIGAPALTNAILGSVELSGEAITVTEHKPAPPHVQHCPNCEVNLMVRLRMDCARLGRGGGERDSPYR